MDMLNEMKLTILAVDDQPVVLHTINTLLKNDYKVVSVTSGHDALNFLAKYKADLVLTDLNMPNMDGNELLYNIKKMPEYTDIPIIFLTGAIGDDAEVDALLSGASDYISKPIKSSVLLSRVKTQVELLLHRKKLEELVTKQRQELVRASEKLKSRREAVYNLLARATDYRDSCTGDHITRTSALIGLMANELVKCSNPDYKISPTECMQMVSSSKLHDIGKIGIPDDILLKPGKLTDDEFEVIKQHSQKGGEILKRAIRDEGSLSFLSMAYDIAMYHHEKWNGTGYPSKLKAQEIPLSARVMTLADVYDALVSNRPYKTAFEHNKAMQIIFEGQGTHFDPYLTDIFIKLESHIDKLIEKYNKK